MVDRPNKLICAASIRVSVALTAHFNVDAGGGR